MADNPQEQPASVVPPSEPKEGVETVRMAEELGSLRKTAKDYEEYRQKVEPILETLYADNELLDKATKAHKKRLGIAVEDTPPPTDPQNPPIPPTNPADTDTRLATVGIIQNDFERKVGIDKLDPTKKAELRGQIGNLVKEMLDPKGNKTISQVFEEVSLTRLPWFLERAYDLLNKETFQKEAYEKGRSEVLAQYDDSRGSIGSLEGGSLPVDEIVLTQKEKETARKMGVSEENYLKNKKVLAEMAR